MAASAVPVFVADLDTIKASMRLGSIVDTDAAAPIINDCVLRARVALYREFGESKVNLILETPTVDNPSSKDQIRRVEANQLETILVKRHLICELPWATMDSANSGPEWYEKEAPFRLTTPEDRQALVKKLEEQARQLSALICANDADTCTGGALNAGSVSSASVIGADNSLTPTLCDRVFSKRGGYGTGSLRRY